MIFKTFDTEIDKIWAKWGMFGHSFSDIGNAVVGKISDIRKGLQDSDGFIASAQNSDSLWKRLQQGSKSEQKRPTDVDSLIPKIDPKTFKFNDWIAELNTIDKKVKNNIISWQDYSNELDDNQKWIAKWGQATEGQIRTQEDLIKANEAARASAINQNRAIREQTLSFRASKAALSALATVGNMAAMWLVSKGIELAVTAFGNYIHQAERAREATKESIRQLNSISAEVESLEGKIADLNEEILRLNPITDADDIKNLKMETTEMSAQLAIMKEQKRLEGKEADSNAQKSLGKLQGSRYAVVESYETVVSDAGLPFVFPTLKPKDVTQYQELEIAVEELEKYYDELDSLGNELESLEEGSEQYLNNSKEINELNKKIDRIREHANDLSISIREQAEGLSGETEASKKLIDAVDAANNKYVELLSKRELKLIGNTAAASKPNILSSLSDSQAEAMEAYKDTLSSVSEAYENPEKHDAGKLMAMFRDYDWSTFLSGAENLDTALRKIATDSLQGVIRQFEGLKGTKLILDELRQAFEDTFDFGHDLSAEQDTLKELEELLEKTHNGESLRQSELAKLTEKYPDLLSAIKAAADGYSLEESAVKSLLEQKTTSYNESVALSMRETEQEIENIKARIKARNSLYQTKPDMPFGTIAQRYAANAVENEADEKKLRELTEYLEGLNFLGAKEAAADKTSIDWLSNSVQNLLEKADALRTAFSNTKGIKAQKAALSDLNKEAAKLRDSYYSPTDNSGTVYGEYQKRYQKALNSLSMDSSLVRSKIETGDIFHMEEFSSADAELINNAIDAWNNMRDAKKKYLELNTELSDNALKALELDAEHLSSLKALTQSRLDTPASDSEQLKLYKELEDCISEYYKTQTAIAKLKQDTAAISSLELERQKELADIEQKRLELVRAQAEAELSQISRSQNQILGTIEYNDGNASAADYNALLQLGAKELEARNKEYERELALLFELETSLGQNSSEYREQQSRVNGIADAIDKCQKNTKDWTKSLLALPVRQIEQAVNGLNQKLEETQNDIDRTDTIIAGAQAYIQKEIDGQEKLKDAVQNQLTSLQKANDERSRTLALQKAQYELERAYSQRTVKVYREGEGFVYEQSLDDIRNAKESYDNANYEKAVASLEKQLEYYDGIISDLEQVKEKWGSIAGDAKDFLNIQQTLSAIGTNGIFSDNVIEGYAKIYTGMLRSKESTEAAIKHLEDFKESIEDVTEQYGLGVATYEECMAAIGQLVSSFYGKAGEEGASALEKIKAIVDQITEQFQLADGSAQINAAAETSAELTKKLQAETQTQADIMQNFADEVSNTFHLVCEASIADASAAFQSLGESIVQTAALIQEQLNSMIGNAGSSLNTLKSIAKEAEKISSSSTQNPGGVNPDTSMPPLGNEHITVLPSKEGEGLLQFSGNGSWDNPQTGSFGITPVKLPEFQPVRFAEASIQSSTPVPVVQNISVTLPNVTNESGYNKFVQTIEHLPLDTIQYINKA